ncbi:DUF3302 domain-containing protein [Aeoliella sp. ICT_H6.2]|uniref:DUF3302 domain-containing protein n=1 Tax=Aeoliella straminimaris TaxID=2954799 RepID=A0A9X2JG03_9BACT|nr:DUF3302 domain-containing protein [Aeoliella straminimaris]
MVDALSWFALVVMLFVVLTLAYGFVAIHEIPHRIAKARNHPHQDAIEAGGWISLFTLHAIWPFLWIWAYAYDPKRGYAGRPSSEPANDVNSQELETLRNRIAELEAKLDSAPATNENDSQSE